MKIYTRREKIRTLKRQRFLTIPPRAAERLEYKCGPSPTVITPYQFKAIAGEHEYMTWPRMAALSDRYKGRSFVFKNWYLIPQLPFIPPNEVVVNHYHEDGYPIVCAIGIDGERWRVYGRGYSMESARYNAIQNLWEYRVRIGGKWATRFYRQHAAFEWDNLCKQRGIQ